MGYYWNIMGYDSLATIEEAIGLDITEIALTESNNIPQVPRDSLEKFTTSPSQCKARSTMVYHGIRIEDSTNVFDG